MLETCWELGTARGRMLTCGIYRTDAPGLEVRAGLNEDDLLRSAHPDEHRRSAATRGRAARSGGRERGFTDKRVLGRSSCRAEVRARGGYAFGE